MKCEAFILCVLLIRTGWGITEAQCPAGMRRDGAHLVVHGDSCYYFELFTPLTYDAAKAACRQMGGRLAVVEDRDTEHFLHEEFHQHFRVHGNEQAVWVGLSSDESGTYTWANGDPLPADHWFNGQQHALDNGQSNACVYMDVAHGGNVEVTTACDGSIFSTAPKHLYICEYKDGEQMTAGAVTTTTVRPIITAEPVTNMQPITTTTAAQTTAAISGPSSCFTCGDINSKTPCTRQELLPNNAVRCPVDKPYCMNDIYQVAGQEASMYKRCVDEATCKQEWYIESSDKMYCFAYDPAVYRDDLVCHVCCYGDECNRDLVPPENTRYKP